VSNLPIPPSSNTIDPALWPPIKDQGGYYTCVAEAITTVLELFHSRAMGLDDDSTSMYEYYSIQHLFGSDGQFDPETGELKPKYGNYGMDFIDALNEVLANGVPRWELADNFYPQRSDKSTSMDVYERSRSNSTIVGNAAKQEIRSWSAIDFYNKNGTYDIEQCLNAGGYVLLGITVPNNMYYLIDDGYLQPPDSPAPADDPKYETVGHMLAIIGLMTNPLDEKKYWIAVNSWGEYWGNDGVCYIPYDWGFDRDPAYVTKDYTINWVRGCFAVRPSNIDINHPNPPTITSAKFVENDSQGKRRAEISFTVDNNCSVLVYARKKNDVVDLSQRLYVLDPNDYLFYINDKIAEVRHENGAFLTYVLLRWWPKGENGSTDFGNAYSESDSPVTITLDNTSDIFEVSLIAVNNITKVLSLRSTIVEINGSNIFIYHNGDWVPATPYIYHNGDWVQAQAKIFQNGWK